MRGEVAVIGAGIVGARTTRELVSSSARGVALFTSRSDRAEILGHSFATEARLVVSTSPLDDLAEDCETVVLAGDAASQPVLARGALQRGCDVVAVLDDTSAVKDLLSLGELARSMQRRVVVGAAFSPGLSCLLASLAASEMDAVEEIHIARVGAGGPHCADSRLAALRSGGLQWREGRWVHTRAGSGRELAWFPEPIGARDCYLVDTAEPLVLLQQFPDLRRAVVRMSMTRRDRFSLGLPRVLPAPPEGGVGAIRVEVRGARSGERATTVLGAMDRPAVVCAALVAQVVEDLDDAPVGAAGLAAWPEPGAMLSRLRTRGIRVAVASD